jgi:hypothetical protein
MPSLTASATAFGTLFLAIQITKKDYPRPG